MKLCQSFLKLQRRARICFALALLAAGLGLLVAFFGPVLSTALTPLPDRVIAAAAFAISAHLMLRIASHYNRGALDVLAAELNRLTRKKS